MVSSSKLPSSSALARADGVKVRWLDWDCIEQVEKESSWRVVSDADSTSASAEVNDHHQEDDDGLDANLLPSENHADDAYGRPCWTCPRLDVIIGSDVICDEGCAIGVARLLSRSLRKDGKYNMKWSCRVMQKKRESKNGCLIICMDVMMTGIAYFTAPFPQHRFGVDTFPAKLKGR